MALTTCRRCKESFEVIAAPASPHVSGAVLCPLCGSRANDHNKTTIKNLNATRTNDSLQGNSLHPRIK